MVPPFGENTVLHVHVYEFLRFLFEEGFAPNLETYLYLNILQVVTKT